MNQRLPKTPQTQLSFQTTLTLNNKKEKFVAKRKLVRVKGETKLISEPQFD